MLIVEFEKAVVFVLVVVLVEVEELVDDVVFDELVVVLDELVLFVEDVLVEVLDVEVDVLVALSSTGLWLNASLSDSVEERGEDEEELSISATFVCT